MHGCVSASSRNARLTISLKNWMSSTSRTQNSRRGAGSAQRPWCLLTAAVAVSAAFLPENVTVVSTNGQTTESKQVLKASPKDYAGRAGADPIKTLPAALKKVPLVVLVNEGSASASEIVAGALQDHQRATIMGSRLLAKARSRPSAHSVPDTGVKFTTSRYYTPSGRSIQAKGIVPDLMVDDTEEGSPYAVLRMREADLDSTISSGQGEEKKDLEREKAREAAIKRLEEESKKPESERRLPEFGSEKDFPLAQALNKLKGREVVVSKTQTERKSETKEKLTERPRRTRRNMRVLFGFSAFRGRDMLLDSVQLPLS